MNRLTRSRTPQVLDNLALRPARAEARDDVAHIPASHRGRPSRPAASHQPAEHDAQPVGRVRQPLKKAQRPPHEDGHEHQRRADGRARPQPHHRPVEQPVLIRSRPHPAGGAHQRASWNPDRDDNFPKIPFADQTVYLDAREWELLLALDHNLVATVGELPRFDFRDSNGNRRRRVARGDLPRGLQNPRRNRGAKHQNLMRHLRLSHR